MVVVSIRHQEFVKLLGSDIPFQRLVERIPMLGTDLERVEGDTVEVEVFPNRPDLYSVEGMVRAMRAFLGIAPGLREYAGEPPEFDVHVDPSVLEVRRWIVGAVLRKVRFDDVFIRSAIDIQEKLHGTLGRDRAKVAIGLHDIRDVTPPYTYAAVDPDSVRFEPLGMTGARTMREILRDHDKGKAYAHLLEKARRYPLITDQKGTVLSFPPIINGTTTALTQRTTDIFVDVTGTDLFACKIALNIIVCLFADRGAAISRVNVLHPDRMMVTPDLDHQAGKVDVPAVNRFLGLSLTPQDMAACLERMGHKATVAGTGIRVLSPCYRSDLLHPLDLAEDVAIGHGYERFAGAMPHSPGYGRPHEVTERMARARRVMVGLGFTEALTFTLTNPRDEYERSRFPPLEHGVVANPKTEDHRILRTALVPSLLATLCSNKHRDLPQRFFEVGDVVLGGENRCRLAGVVVHDKASFTEVKSLVARIARDLGRTVDMVRAEHPAFLAGRALGLQERGRDIGIAGELHPAVIVGWELVHPVVALEVEL